MSKNLRTAVVAFSAVILAGVTLEYDWGVYAAVGALLAGILAGYFSGYIAERQLPGRPLRWVKWVAGREATPDSVLVGVAAAALYLAVEWGKDVEKIDASLTGLAAFGAIAGVAFVKVLDVFASEADWIDDYVESFAKKTFQRAYEPKLRDGSLPATELDNGHTVKTNVWWAVTEDRFYGGWGAGARKKRAETVKRALSVRVR